MRKTVLVTGAAGGIGEGLVEARQRPDGLCWVLITRAQRRNMPFASAAKLDPCRLGELSESRSH